MVPVVLHYFPPSAPNIQPELRHPTHSCQLPTWSSPHRHIVESKSICNRVTFRRFESDAASFVFQRWIVIHFELSLKLDPRLHRIGSSWVVWLLTRFACGLSRCQSCAQRCRLAEGSGQVLKSKSEQHGRIPGDVEQEGFLHMRRCLLSFTAANSIDRLDGSTWGCKDANPAHWF